jgi:hypothetical protein
MIAFNKIREVLNESFFNDIDDETVNKSAEELESGSQEETEEYGYPNIRTQAQNCVFKTRANIYRSVGDSREQMINTQLNIYRMRKMMFVIFNNMKSVDTVSIKTDLNLVSSAEIVDTMYDMVPTKDKPFCFEYFDMEAEKKKHPRLALYHNWWFDIEIHFSVNKEASYDTFISDISNMCNMMKRVHIDVDKDTEIYKEGGTKYGLMTKSYNSDKQLKNIYRDLFEKDESDIKELKDTAEYWYDKLGVQDMIMNYIQNSDLNIINYDISIRALDADEDYSRRPIVITIFLKPEDKPYSINSVLHDIIYHFIKVSNAWKDISMTVPFIFRIFDYKGRQMKTLK